MNKFITNCVANLGYEKLLNLNNDLCMFSNHIAAHSAIISIGFHQISSFF